jgi:hypothetical protein
VYLEADGNDGNDGPPGPPGPSGAAGVQGVPGVALFMLAQDGDDGYDGRPGPPGPTGPTGATGTGGGGGGSSPVFIWDHDSPDETAPVTGYVDNVGNFGVAGTLAANTVNALSLNVTGISGGLFNVTGQSTPGTSVMNNVQIGTGVPAYGSFSPLYANLPIGGSYALFVPSGGISAVGGSTFDTITITTGIQMNSGSILLLNNGNASVPSITINPSTLLTTPSQGAVEFDGKLEYFTPVGTARALTPSVYYYRNNTFTTLTSAATAQSIFGLTNGVTLAANTIYEVEGFFSLVTTGTTPHTEAFGFTLTTATLTAAEYTIFRNSIAAPNPGTYTQAISTVATATVMTASITTAQGSQYSIKGHLAIGTGGTVNPFIQFSAAPGGTSTVNAGAWFKFSPVGTTGNNVSIGTWA